MALLVGCMASSTAWTSIPVHPEVRNLVREEKPDGMSYSEFLQGLVDEGIEDDETQRKSLS